MYQRRRARVLLAVLTLVALILITIDVRSGDSGLLHGTRGVATAVLQPVQDGFGVLIRPFGVAASSVRELFGIRAENEVLRRQVEALSERRNVVADLERENRELRRLLDMAERNDFDTVAARVVSLAPSTFEWTVTIDAGVDDGVERDMAVIGASGLVGRVVQVTATSSRVLLAIDPNFFAAARAARTGETGLVEGRGSEPMVMRLLDPQADVEPGDEIVTSAYQGGVFPAGIPLGVVADAGDPDSRLTREATILPYVDFTRVHHVLVVVGTPIAVVPPLTGTPDVDFDAPDVDRFRDPSDDDATGEVPDGLDALPDDETDADDGGETTDPAP